MFQKETINRLKDLGLNSYEARLWVALLSRGVSTAGELSDIADVPRSRSYDVLESLEKKGFIVMKLGKPIKYIAVQPDEVINRVKKRVEEEAISQQGVLDGMQKSEFIDQLDLLYNQGINHIEPLDMTGVIRGRSNIYNHLSYMIKNAKKDVVISTSEEGLVRKSKSLKNALKRAKDNGATVRVLASLHKKSNTSLLKNVAQVKEPSSALPRFCVVDGKQAFMMLLDDKKVHPTYDAGVWISTPYVAGHVASVFDSHWDNAKK